MNKEELKTLEIDMDRNIFKVNGRDISNSGHYMSLTFEHGTWSLMITEDTLYSTSDSACKKQNAKEADKRLKALEGITYPEWVKLKIGMDRYFDQEKGESEKNLKLANVKSVEKLIQSQFG